ncbi:MAG: hypothetical protein QW641_01045 [Candidatus Aenigmatarchaeota archaeon]
MLEFQKILSLREFYNHVKEGKYSYLNVYERLYRKLSEDSIGVYPGIKFYKNFYKNSTIKGLPEVINKLVDALFIGDTLFKSRGKLSILYLYGPTGSGKTLIGKALDNIFYHDLEENPCMKVVKIMKKEDNTITSIEPVCIYGEYPLAVFTSDTLNLTSDIKSEITKETNFNYKMKACDNCINEVNNSIVGEIYKLQRDIEFLTTTTFKQKISSNTLLKMLDSLYVVEYKPQNLSIDFSNEKMLEMIEGIVKKSNRGILHINADNVKNFKDQNVQFLLRIADGQVTFENASSVSLDMLPILYSNEAFFEWIKGNTVLYSRVIPIPVRRLLSYSLESEVLKSFILPFSHISPNSLELYSMFIIATRIQGSYSNEIENLLRLYEKYENYRVLTEEEFKKIKERLMGEVLKDGWAQGLTSEEAVKYLYSLTSEDRTKCLTLSTINSLTNSIVSERGYKIQADIINKKIVEHALKDIIIATMLAIEDKFLESLEMEFEEYKKLHYMKYAKGETFVRKAGELISIDSEMENILKRLLLVDKNKIDNILTTEGGAVTFYSLLKENPQLIGADERIKKYIDWKNFEHLVGEGIERKEKIINKMITLGYCRECTISAIKIALEKLIT